MKHIKETYKNEVNKIVASFHNTAEVVQPFLHEAQSRYNHIPETVIEQLASNLGLPASDLYALTANYNNRWYCQEDDAY